MVKKQIKILKFNPDVVVLLTVYDFQECQMNEVAI